MPRKKIEAVAELSLDAKDARRILDDIRNKIKDIETAADKMTVFKDMVKYISQVDKALTALKNNNVGAFNNMFDGLDSNFRQEMEKLFGVDGAVLGQLDVLREKLATLTPKSGIKDIRNFAKEINGLFKSVGLNEPFNIEEQFSGRASQAHIELLTNELSNFAVVWKDVNNQVSKGFGGSGGGTGKGVFGELSKEAQEEVKKLEDQASKYKSIINKFKEVSKMKEAWDDGDQIKLDFEASEQVAQELIDKFNQLGDVIEEADAESADYANALAERAKIALQLIEINERLTKKNKNGDVIKESPKFLRDFVAMDDDGESLPQYALEDFEYEASELIEKLGQEAQETTNKIEELKNTASSVLSQGAVGQGGGVESAINNIGNAADEAKKKIVNLSEYVSALSGQLKEMFSATGRSANFEYHIAIDGLDIKARHGSEKSIDIATQTETYLDTLFSQSAIYGHSHRGGTAATNIYDIESVLSSYRDGVAIPVHFVVGKDSITTIDFTGLSQDMVDQLMHEIAATNNNKNAPVVNDNINKIVEKFTGKSGALKTWSVEQFDDLAKYLYDVSSAASSALTPVEKFQAVLDNMFGKGKVDANKYESLLSGLNKDNAKNIFNQIASIEKLQPIKTTDMLSMGQVNAEIDESIAKYKTLREEANLSYSDIRNEVDKVIAHYNAGGSATSGLDFFQTYFPEGEWQNVRNLLTDAYENLISLEEVTNRIASEFGVDPDTFAQIPSGVQDTQINDAKSKLEEFLALSKEIQDKNFFNTGSAEDNVEVGKYAEKLEAAKNELVELGRQGQITAYQLESVNTAFDAAKMHLDRSTQHYDGYGSGYGDYSYDYVKEERQRADEAENRADILSAENDELRNQIAELRSQKDHEGKAATGGGTVASTEAAQLEILHAKLLEVKAAVDSKTQAFEEEYVTVDAAVQAEIASLQTLMNQLLEVAAQINSISNGLLTINNTSVSLDINADSSQLEATQNIDTEVNQLSQLQQALASVTSAIAAKTKAFVDEGSTVGQVVGKEIAALMQLSGIVDSITPKVNSLVDGLTKLNKQDKDITPKKDEESTDKKKKEKTPEEKFKEDKSNQIASLDAYRKSLKDVDYLTSDLRAELQKLAEDLANISTPLGLEKFKKDLANIKRQVAAEKSAFEFTNFGYINNKEQELKSAFNSLNLDQQTEIRVDYDNAIAELEHYKISVQDGKRVELDAINSVIGAIQRKMEAYKQANKEEQKNQKQLEKSNNKFGETAAINATAKFNRLSELANSDQFEGSQRVQEILVKYTEAYEKMIAKRNELSQLTGDVSDPQKAEFKKLTDECNTYAKALEKVITNSEKLIGSKVNKDRHMLGADFVDDENGRLAALTEFVNKMDGVDAATIRFTDNFNKCMFTVNNGDGTFTKMTATFTDARNEIVALGGETKKATSLLGGLWNELKGKFKSIGTYLVASVSFYEVWNVIKQGVGYVTEIDSALTELKKVTDETDASYGKFLQNMSKTAGTIGSTVAELTTMASEWARLGYSMEEAGKLAESTAILLNVSEFQDATTASEALISTMQAFQYTASESQHVVDILNEVGF